MGTTERDEGQYDTVVPVFWATGAALFIRLTDYTDVGGLDARFLRIWKRSTFVGGFVLGGEALSVFRKA